MHALQIRHRGTEAQRHKVGRKNKIFNLLKLCAFCLCASVPFILNLNIAEATSIDEDINIVKNHNIENELRYNAVERLGKSGEKKAIDTLISLFSEEEQWTIRRRIVAILGDTGYIEAIEPLKTALKSDVNIFVRSDAALSLSKFKMPGVFESLTDALTNDTSVFVRSDAAKALGTLGDKRAIPFLKKAINDEGVAVKFIRGKEIKSKEVSAAAAASLAMFKEEDEPEALGEFIADIKKEKKEDDTEKVPSVSNIEKNDEKGEWAIQLLSAKGEGGNISVIEKKIKDSGYNAYTVTATINNNTWYRLRVGTYKSKDEALRQAEEISKKFNIKNPLVVKLSGGEEK